MAPTTSAWQGFPYATVLFDVDGTLIDSNGAHAETWLQALREHDIDAEIAGVRALVGMGSDHLLPAVARISEESDLGRAIAQRKNALFQLMIPGLRPRGEPEPWWSIFAKSSETSSSPPRQTIVS